MSSTTKLRVLIVDDEPLARMRVREMLRHDEDIEVVGECADGHEAIAAIKKQAPHLIFLDVQMPEIDGFDVLRSLRPAQAPLVIFMTAYDQYAVQAFEVYALDYLLKPFNLARLERALERAKDQISRVKSQDINDRTQALLEEIKGKYLERLVIKTTGRIFLLKTAEIDWIETEDNYVRLHRGSESHLLRETIRNLETQLDPKKFIRIHRRTIVNIDRVRELRPWFKKDYRVILQDGTELAMSRNYREKLEEFLGRPI